MENLILFNERLLEERSQFSFLEEDEIDLSSVWELMDTAPREDPWLRFVALQHESLSKYSRKSRKALEMLRSGAYILDRSIISVPRKATNALALAAKLIHSSNPGIHGFLLVDTLWRPFNKRLAHIITIDHYITYLRSLIDSLDRIAMLERLVIISIFSTLMATVPALTWPIPTYIDEWPDGHRLLSTTWPWNVKISILVIWGVCWMFYGEAWDSYEFDSGEVAMGFGDDTQGFPWTRLDTFDEISLLDNGGTHVGSIHGKGPSLVLAPVAVESSTPDLTSSQDFFRFFPVPPGAVHSQLENELSPVSGASLNAEAPAYLTSSLLGVVSAKQVVLSLTKSAFQPTGRSTQPSEVISKHATGLTSLSLPVTGDLGLSCEHPDCAFSRPTFGNENELQKHKNRHIYICDVPNCKRREGFTSKGDLDRHRKEVHYLGMELAELHFCPHRGCKRAEGGVGFPRRHNLEDHVKRRHSKSRRIEPSKPILDILDSLEAQSQSPQELGQARQKRRLVEDTDTENNNGRALGGSEVEDLKAENKRLRREIEKRDAQIELLKSMVQRL